MAKVYIHGEIGDYWWGDSVSFKSFKKDFDAAVAQAESDQSAIEIHINSPGGSVSEGIAIYNHIVNSGKQVTTIIDGIAYSMGAIIAMAGTERKAAKNSTILLHNCWGWAMGNVSDLEQSIEMMRALDSNLIGAVADMTGISEDDVKTKWFDYKDHTLTAKQALEEGLLTQLISPAENVPTGSVEEVIAHFRQNKGKEEGFLSKLEKRLIAALGSKQTVVPPAAAQTPENIIDISKMNITEKLDLLLSAEATPEQRAAARTELEQVYAATEVFTQEEVDTRVTDAQAALQATIDAQAAEIADLRNQPAASHSPKGVLADPITNGEKTLEEIRAEIAAQEQANLYN